MDDADLNENIGDYTEEIDGRNVNNEQIHLDPSRWWFASAAFPLMAGTLGPVASAFSICALVRPWRQHIPPGLLVNQAEFINDPIWLIAINAIQLVIALIANVFLLLNMAKRVRFSIAQPITIVGWYISAICLIGLVASASGPLVKQPEIEFVWSSALYYGMISAILYFIVSSFMVVTVWGAQTGHYAKDFELTTSQRTLMLQTIMFLMYLLLGALVFSTIEGWNYLDTVYWADVTLFTIGYGDFSPTTKLGRGLLIPYALVGVISLGLVIGSIRSLVLDRGKRRLDARMLEKKRRQLLRHMRRKGKDGILEPIDALGNNDSNNVKEESRKPRTEFDRRRREFQLMRKVQDKATTRRRWLALTMSSSTWLVLWLVGAKIFQACEERYQHWSYFDSFYFAFTGLTTIGYGSPLTPISPSGKAFFVFWSLIALPTTTVLISNAGDTIVKYIRDGTIVIGNLSILPTEHGFKAEAKRVMAKFFSFGGGLSKEEDIEESPPGFLGAAQRRHDEEDKDDSDEFENDTNIHPNNWNGHTTSKSNASPPKAQEEKNDKLLQIGQAASFEREEIPTELPKTRCEYHLVLIDEIARVTKHIQASPPRKYTFREWAWYLHLIGEDESSADTHQKPAQKPSGKDQKQNKKKWSWVGHRSPLMETKEEAEWILERLEQKLRDELQAVVKKKQGADGLKHVKSEEDENEYIGEKMDRAVIGGDRGVGIV